MSEAEKQLLVSAIIMAAEIYPFLFTTLVGLLVYEALTLCC